MAALSQPQQTHVVIYKVEVSQLLVSQIIRFQILCFFPLDLPVDLHQHLQERCSQEMKKMKLVVCSSEQNVLIFAKVRAKDYYLSRLTNYIVIT